MKGWTAPLQRASYRGVRFDEITRATIEHAYPFVNGADVEDLGLNPLTVRLQAVFYGEGYYTDFKKFLSVLGKQGADVLVHPIRGRLQNMICTSALFHHEADMIDYVAIDLTFTESTPAEPIFVFESAFLARLDALLTQLEDFVDDDNLPELFPKQPAFDYAIMRPLFLFNSREQNHGRKNFLIMK